jgi:hypothetical protein
MATDTQAMGLLIRIMPLMMREFAMRIEPTQFFNDSGYAAAVLETAEQSAQERLQRYAQELRARMAALAEGPRGALRSAAAPMAGAGPGPRPGPGADQGTDPPGTPVDPAPSAQPAVKYTRTLR